MQNTTEKNQSEGKTNKDQDYLKAFSIKEII